MSYAAAASKNRLPPEQQPHPDQSLLEGEHRDPQEHEVHSADEKVHIVTRDEFEDENRQPEARPEPVRLSSDDASATNKSADQQAQEAKAEAKKDAAATKEEFKKQAGAAAAAVETTGQEAKKDVAQAEKTAEKKVEKGKEEAEKKFEKGKEEAKREYDALSEKAKKAYNKMSAEAQRDWHTLSSESKKRWEAAKNSDAGQELQKPQVWGSLLGVTNLAVLGTVGYFAYTNWGRPRWDRRVVSATAIGLAGWFGLQGYILPQTDAVQQRTR